MASGPLRESGLFLTNIPLLCSACDGESRLLFHAPSFYLFRITLWPESLHTPAVLALLARPPSLSFVCSEANRGGQVGDELPVILAGEESPAGVTLKCLHQSRKPGGQVVTGLMKNLQMALEASEYGLWIHCMILVTSIISQVVSDKIFLKTSCERMKCQNIGC